MKKCVDRNDILGLPYVLKHGKLPLIWEKKHPASNFYRTCSRCGAKLVKNGKTKGRKQRFICIPCGYTVSFGKEQKEEIRFKAFKVWVGSAVTTNTISKFIYKKSLRTLFTHFHTFLANSPTPEVYFHNLINCGAAFGGTILIDADWFGNEYCLIIYRDYPSGEIVFFRYAEGEYKNIFLSDIAFLVINGYPLKGVVSDWKSSIVATVKEISFKYFEGNLPHQRCLVHTQLQCQTFLTRRPKTEAGRNLLELVHLLNHVKTFYHRNILCLWLVRFTLRFLPIIKERTYSEDKKSWWYTHKYLRRTFLILKNNWDHLFVYLDYPFLIKDTNRLEGLFSQLDNSLGRHRGLSRKNRPNFLYWFFFLKRFPNIKLSDIGNHRQ